MSCVWHVAYFLRGETVFVDRPVAMVLYGNAELALTLTFKGSSQEYYVLVKNMDDELLSLVGQWRMQRGKDTEAETYSKIMEILQKRHIRRNLSLVA